MPEPKDPNRPETHGAGPEAGEADPVVAGLLSAYAEGVFPMAHPDGAVYLYDPDPRGIIPVDRPENGGGLRVSRSLRARLRSGRLPGGRFRVTADTAFGRVIRACAAPRAGQTGEEGWIDTRIVDAYERLHDAGCAHSVELWLDGETDPAGERLLVGGLYGVRLGGLYAGESMFSRPDLGGTDASKVCLVALWRHLRARGCTLLDTQFMTDHLRSLGGVEISRAEYHERLAAALAIEAEWAPFSAVRLM